MRRTKRESQLVFASIAGAGVLLLLVVGTLLRFNSGSGMQSSERASHPTDELALNGLGMLEIGDSFTDPHEKQIWYIAANMANRGYRFNDDSALEMTAADLNGATFGYSTVHPPTSNPLNIEWKLRRFSGGPSLLTAVKRGGNFDRKMVTEFQQEWKLAAIKPVSLTRDEHAAANQLIETAWKVYVEDSKPGTSPSTLNEAITVKQRNWVDEEGARWYDLRLAQRSGSYDFEVWVSDNHIGLDDGPSCVFGLSFSYLGVDAE